MPLLHHNYLTCTYVKTYKKLGGLCVSSCQLLKDNSTSNSLLVMIHLFFYTIHLLHLICILLLIYKLKHILLLHGLLLFWVKSIAFL